jgi:hypothetical protein
MTADGSWAGFLALEPGANTIRATAVAEEGAKAERRIQVSRVDQAAERDRARPAVDLVVQRNRLLEDCLLIARQQRLDAERERNEEIRRALQVEIERERQKRASAPISSASSSIWKARTTGRLALAAVWTWSVAPRCVTVKSRFSLNTLSASSPGPATCAASGGHRAGGIDHPGIARRLEPQRDHVVLPVGGRTTMARNTSSSRKPSSRRK